MTVPRNTLYVTTQGAYVAKDHENAQVRVEREVRLSVPLHHLEGIACFGRVSVSPDLMGECAERGILISFLSEQGRYLSRLEGPVGSASQLRRAQYRAAEDAVRTVALAKSIVLGKISNARSTLLRAARDAADPACGEALSAAASYLEHRLAGTERADTLDSIRGNEGEAAARYFEVFDRMVRKNLDAFTFERRSRRPPLNPMNALLSFLYALLLHDASAALEGAGLDPAVGFLHEDRPGRPSLALDLVEEFRAFLADRTALALVNLGQVKPEGFRKLENGAVEMDDGTRREVIVAYQKRKQEEIKHPFTGETQTVGLLVHIQARLLARAIRGELDAYPPFHAR